MSSLFLMVFSSKASRSPSHVLPLFLALGALLLGLSGCADPEKSAVEALAEKRYSFSTDDWLLAAEAGDLEAIRLFREAGQDINATDASGNTALMRAASGGQMELLEILLAAGADSKAANAKGRTPLMFAAENGGTAALRALLAKGSEVERADQEGWSALKLAAYGGRAEAVELLSGRVDQESLDQVLLVACFKGDPAVIDLLLKHGAYVNTRSPENLTPLMIAAQAGHAGAVKLLIRRQANPYALDDSENTAANLAEAAGHTDLRDLLLDPTALMEVVESGADQPGSETTLDAMKTEEEIVNTLGALVGDPVGSDGARLAVAGAAKVISGTPATKGQVISGQPANPTLSGKRAVPADGRHQLVSIDGKRLESSEKGVSQDPVIRLKMQSYREKPLPIILKSVEPTGGVARVRVLSGPDPEPVAVSAGESIPGTPFKVASVDSKFISSKMGRGSLVDVSQVMVEDTRSGEKHLLIKDVPGRSGDTYATLTLPGSPFDYVVKNGDVFRAVTGGGAEQDFEVLDVRPTQVVIRNVSTDEVVTVNRDGIAMR